MSCGVPVILQRCALKNDAHSFKVSSKGWNLTVVMAKTLSLICLPNERSPICALRALFSVFAVVIQNRWSTRFDAYHTIIGLYDHRII